MLLHLSVSHLYVPRAGMCAMHGGGSCMAGLCMAEEGVHGRGCVAWGMHGGEGAM